jgi:hypothetical protein
MTQMAELTMQLMPGGRQTKYTPERVQQIRNLVERGKSLVEIAELVGVTDLLPCFWTDHCWKIPV